MHTARLALAAVPLALAAGVACGQQLPVSKDRPDSAAPQSGQAGQCRPVESGAPNAASQRPAFAGQTRACAVRSSAAPAVTVITRELDAPWAVEPLPDGSFLVTEKPGRMRIVAAAGTVGPAIEGVPPVDARGQGGLLDVALSPSFATDRTIFWSYSEPRGGNTNATSVARGVLSADGRRLDQVRVIFRAQPAYAGTMHYGSRLAFGPDGMLYVTTGDRSDAPMRPTAQRLDNHMGKTLRITTDGAAPRDNPFVGRAGAVPEVWSYGHRNIQAAAFDAQGRYWEIEHGTRGGDEVNLVERGKNYGWPLQAYGIEYRGGPIEGGSTRTAVEGTEQPVYYWDPVIAPSGAQWYTGTLFPEWRDNLFVGGLQALGLVRLVVENGRVTGEEHLLTDRRKRIRDVRQGPDGALYILTDRSPGELWRVAPR